MFCRFCGTTIPDDFMFCHSCGKTLSTPPAPATAASAEPAPAAELPHVAPIPGAKPKRQTRLWVLLAIFALVAWFALATAHHEADERGRRLDALTAQMAGAQSRNAGLKQRFLDAVHEDASTMDAYIRHCQDVETALQDYEPALREADGQLAQLIELAPGQRAQGEAVRKVLAIDIQLAQAFRREVSLAKQLQGMRPRQQSVFYQSNIVPVQEEENRLSQREIQVIRDAKAAGVKLPDNLSKIAE